MGLRFYRRLHVLPGVRVNLGTQGASVSFGHRGAWYTVGRQGRRTATLGWPGTGLRYTTTDGGAAPWQGVPPAPAAMWGIGVALLVGAVLLVALGRR